MFEQMKLFEEDYRTLEELRQIITELHPTGGRNNDGTFQYTEYKLEFYKDLAFIVIFRDEQDGHERIIDNCVELEQVEENLYQIIKIDGKALGDIEESEKKISVQKSLIKSLEKKELFKRSN